MVLVFLGNLQFEAAKFETRTMPTPNMKGKEMIYWIKVETQEKRLVTELERFLTGTSQHIDLRVPSVFVAARVELENYKPSVADQSDTKKDEVADSRSREQLDKQVGVEKTYVIEIILRRTLPDQPAKQNQSPYG